MYNVAVIVGSLRKESFNRQLARALDKLNHPKIKFNFINIENIPLFNQDYEDLLPNEVAIFKDSIQKADGVLFVTPEYNRSIPGVLKNVIDWGTRPYGKNVWKRKPIGMIGTSPGAIGTAVAQSHLRSIMSSIDGIVLGFPEVYIVFKKDFLNDQCEIKDENSKKFLQEFLTRFEEWIAIHSKNL